MSEAQLVDTRGLSCPMPVMLVRQQLAKMDQGSLEVLVDNATARDNVTRLAEREGWKAAAEERADGSVRLVLSR